LSERCSAQLNIRVFATSRLACSMAERGLLTNGKYSGQCGGHGRLARRLCVVHAMTAAPLVARLCRPLQALLDRAGWSSRPRACAGTEAPRSEPRAISRANSLCDTPDGQRRHARTVLAQRRQINLAEEFTKMMVSQPAYSANACVITTTDEIIDGLIRISRQ
jgi:Flagellar basal body rod FlgEFG protein C-terminal